MQNRGGWGGIRGSRTAASTSSRNLSEVLGETQNALRASRSRVAEKTDVRDESSSVRADTEQSLPQARISLGQARLRATFYPKFENEKSDHEIRMKMLDVVHSGTGILEVTLKHSGSLFMYAGDLGGAYAKNSFGNLYTAVGVFVLGRTLQEAWGVQAKAKQKEFNNFLEKEHVCISMELVTAVLGDHGQRPLQDYVVVTAVTDLKSKPCFYSTPDLIAFCRKWRLPTNDVWLFSSRKSAMAFFTAYDALCEEGTASSVSKVLDELADLSVPASKSHTEVQGEILEGLVTRIVSPRSTEQLRKVLADYPMIDCKGEVQLGPSLREICAAYSVSEKQQVKMLLEYVGPDMCSDISDWASSQTNSSLLNKFLNADPADNMTMKFQEMINLLQERNMQVRYPCRMKGYDPKAKKAHYKLTVHVLNDHVFRKYQKEMIYNPGLWPLYRGFFVDIFLFYGQKPTVRTSLCDQFEKSLHISTNEDAALADESENLMVKLKFLPYKIRTFLIRNGLSKLFKDGFQQYRRYYFKQMEIWGTSLAKQRHLDHLLTQWAEYITNRSHETRISDDMYLSEAEPFLERYAKQSPANSRLVGFRGNKINVEAFLSSRYKKIEDSAEEEIHREKAASDYSETPRSAGMLIFFPGIPGCGKSALCKELLKSPESWVEGKKVHSLMGDLIKGKYWPRLAEEHRKDCEGVILADKNAPNFEVWKTIEEICKSTHSRGVPIVPDSEGTNSNPFSVDVLALFMYRVLQRVNHPGNLDRNSQNPGYVLLMFYNLYDGKDRVEFEETLKGCFGCLVKLPVLKANRPPLPPDITGVIRHGLELFRQHTGRHGKMESTKGSLRNEWARWEKQLREVLSTNTAYFDSVQVPFEEVVKSVQQQFRSVGKGETVTSANKEVVKSVQQQLGNVGKVETATNASTEVQNYKPVAYAAVTLPIKEIIDVLQKVTASSKDLETYFQGKGIISSLKSAHVTLAHKASHGVSTVRSYEKMRGLSVLVQLTALLYSKKICAFEAYILANSKGVTSKNEWPHVTIWTAQGTPPKEANSLPQLVEKGEAYRVEFSKPVVIPGVVELL